MYAHETRGRTLDRTGGLGLIGRAYRALGRHYEARRATEHLLRLDDHLLADIGVTRGDVAEMVTGHAACRG